MPAETEPNFATFRDCVSVAVIERSGGVPVQITVKKGRSSKRGRSADVAEAAAAEKIPGSNAFEDSTPAELAEFVEYIAAEAFPSLPPGLRKLTYQALREDEALAKTYSTPLASDFVDDIANSLPPSIEDTLLAYRLINPPGSDISSFLTPVLNSYVSAVTTPPPHPLSTRVEACELCERDWIGLTYHHLIPRGVHEKVLKRGWHPEYKLNGVAWLCRACHSFVHRIAGNEELAREWYSVELIKGREDVRRWVAWVGGVRWKKR